MPSNNRLDHKPGIRQEYERHKHRILVTQRICGICGQPVDMTLKYPDPGSPTVDHIIPISRGGHPSALENLQLAHFRCNRLKFNQMELKKKEDAECRGDALLEPTRPRKGLPWSLDWSAYRYDETANTSNAAELFQQAEQIRQSGFTISIEGVTKNS